MSRLVEVTFSLLYVAGTGAMGLGILISFAAATEHIVHLQLFAIAAGLFLLAALIALLTWEPRDIWYPTPTVLVFMAVQFFMCLGLGWGAYIHLHTM